MRNPFIFAALAVLALGAGCVSQGTFDKLDAEQKETLGQLDSERSRARSLEEALAAERAKARGLEAEKAAIVKDRSRLESSVGEMQLALAELSKRKAEADARITEYRELLARFQSLIDAGKLRVKIVEGRMVVELASDVLFAPGSATLSKEGKAAIVEVAGLLASIQDRKFQVEGHTDNVPIATAMYPSNWELGAARALTVLKTMADAGMPPTRISAATFGDSKPAQPNDTPEGKAANRRIEIVVVPDLSSLPGFDELNRTAKIAVEE